MIISITDIVVLIKVDKIHFFSAIAFFVINIYFVKLKNIS